MAGDDSRSRSPPTGPAADRRPPQGPRATRPRSRTPERQQQRRRSPRDDDRRSSYRDYDRDDRPRDRDRDRESFPRDNQRRSHQNNGRGFRWKEKRPRGEGEDERDGRLERGYRRRSRSRDRGRGQDGDIGREEGRDGVKNARAKKDAPVEDKLGVADKFGPANGQSSASTSETKTVAVSAPAPTTTAAYSEPMIIVHVNDRLGTKAAIPCLASDPIKLFKAQVAARIGRQPHEILLKRQGERPFKDALSLEDYGVGNGVQLDLEIDTGE